MDETSCEVKEHWDGWDGSCLYLTTPPSKLPATSAAFLLKEDQLQLEEDSLG